MKLRDKLTLAFLLLAVLPLTSIVLFSYATSQRTFRNAVEAETAAVASRLGGSMDSLRGDIQGLVDDLGKVPFPLLVAAQGGGVNLTDIYSELTDIVGKTAGTVEWLEFTPAGAAEGDERTSYAIFPSEALARALSRLERYSDLDPESAAALDESVAVVLQTAIKRYDQLETAEVEALEASSTHTTEVLGSEFAGPVEQDGEMVGELRVHVRPHSVLRRLLSRTASEGGEMPYALDSFGTLYVAAPGDRDILEELPISQLEAGTPTLRQERPGELILAEMRDESGLSFGIARPIGEALSEMRTTAFRNFAIGLAIVGLSMVGVLWLSGRLTRNVTVLTVGAQRLATGDLQVRVPVRSEDELGELAKAFNHMASELSQKEFLLVQEERRRKEQELRQLLLEAENERKSKELEEARLLQLSLLPSGVPTLPGLDVGASMRSATEVGGDYYDFFQSERGALTTVVGDATGHGARAGAMVTVVKGMLSLGAPTDDLPRFLSRANETILGMQLFRMSMSLTLVHLDQMEVDGVLSGETRVGISAAGMPPALIYRAATDDVEEVVLEGAPLGSLKSFQYQSWESTLLPGDTLLLMSDGFPELQSSSGRALGYDRALTSFAASASGSATEIIASLDEATSKWSGSRAPDDDITFVVLKAKHKESAVS